MGYTISERHSYGNGFRKAQRIGQRKLRHQKHHMMNYYNHGGPKYQRSMYKNKGGAGNYRPFY